MMSSLVDRKFAGQTLALTLATALIAFVSFAALEPAVLTAQTTTASDNVEVSLNVVEDISISDGGNVTMDDIGSADNYADAESSWTVTTNSSGGYTLAVKASSSPALQGDSNGASFADYTESTDGTPDSFTVDGSSYEFGFSAYGSDVNGTTYGSGTNCDTGDPGGTSMLYEGFETSDNTIAQRSDVTPTSGITTNICFAAGQNGVFAPSGSYTATIVATANTQ